MRPHAAAVLVALLVPGAAGAGWSTAWQALGRTDVRARSLLPGDASGAAATADLELNPQASLTATQGPVQLSAAYSPNLLWREPHRLGPARVLHRGRLGLRWAFERVTLTAGEDASWGLADVGALQPAEGQPEGTVEVQTLGLVPYVTSNTRVGLDAALDERLDVGFGAAYVVSGSLTTAQLPLQHGPRVTASLRDRLTRVDSISTTLSASQADYATGASNALLTLVEGWRHRFGRQSELDAGLGGALARNVYVAVPGEPPDVPVAYLMPVATVGLTHRFGAPQGVFDLRLAARVSPFADRFTAAVYERAEGAAALGWTWRGDVRVLGQLGVAQALPLGVMAQAGDRIVHAELSADWTVHRRVLLRAYGRGAFAEQPRLGVEGRFQWLFGLSATFSERGTL